MQVFTRPPPIALIRSNLSMKPCAFYLEAISMPRKLTERPEDVQWRFGMRSARWSCFTLSTMLRSGETYAHCSYLPFSPLLSYFLYPPSAYRWNSHLVVTNSLLPPAECFSHQNLQPLVLCFIWSNSSYYGTFCDFERHVIRRWRKVRTYCWKDIMGWLIQLYIDQYKLSPWLHQIIDNQKTLEMDELAAGRVAPRVEITPQIKSVQVPK